jgi:hypothetical protein
MQYCFGSINSVAGDHILIKLKGNGFIARTNRVVNGRGTQIV